MPRKPKNPTLSQLTRDLAYEQEPGIWDTKVCQTCHSDLCRKGKCVICLKREIAGAEK
jgi:hypothetical protein